MKPWFGRLSRELTFTKQGSTIPLCGDVNTPVIDKAYPLEQTASAMRDPEAGRDRGNLVITLGK